MYGLQNIQLQDADEEERYPDDWEDVERNPKHLGIDGIRRLCRRLKCARGLKGFSLLFDRELLGNVPTSRLSNTQ